MRMVRIAARSKVGLGALIEVEEAVGLVLMPLVAGGGRFINHHVTSSPDWWFRRIFVPKGQS